jgi:hypothetical protein
LPDDKNLRWLRKQFADPKAAYTSREWARMAGRETRQIVRWFVKKEIVERGAGSEHVVTVDEVERVWPDLWRSIRRRLGRLIEEAEAA